MENIVCLSKNLACLQMSKVLFLMLFAAIKSKAVAEGFCRKLEELLMFKWP